MSVTQQQVVTLLENVLFETPTQATANAGTWINNSAASSVQSLATAMAASGEEKIAATVVGYYLASLGRAPNAAEIHYYVAIAEQGLSTTQIAAGQVSSGTWDTIGSYFAHSPEFSIRGNIDFSLGNTAAYLEAVPWLYQSVLGRAASQAELAYYDAQVVNGTDLGTLFREFTASPEFHTDTAAQIATALANFGTAAALGLQTSPAIGATVTLGPPPTTPPPSPAPTPASPFGALTIGTDHIDDSALTGANTYQAILGTGATLGTNDYLKGNGSATLNIQDNGTGSYVLMPTAPLTLTGIPTVTLNTGEDAGGPGGHLFDVSGIVGLTSFHLNATGTGGDYIAVGSGTEVIANTQSATFVLSATGLGNTLALTDANLLNLDLAASTRTTDNIDTLTLTTTAGQTSLNLSVINLTSLHITDSDNHINTLVIGGGVSSSSITAISDTALTSLSTSAGEQISFGSSGAYLSLSDTLTSLDTSDDQADVYFNIGSANTTATFGSGNSFIKGGTGSAITLDGGGLDNTGAVTVNGFDSLTIAADSYSSVTLTGTGASVDITDAAMTSVTVNALTLTGTLTASSSSLTITGGSTASSIAGLSDSSLTTLTVGGGNVTFGSSSSRISLGTSVTTVDLSGDTDTAGTNYFTVNSTGIAITATNTDITNIDLNSKTGALITPGFQANYTGAANLILENVVSGTEIGTGIAISSTLPDNVPSLAALISAAGNDFASNSPGARPSVLYSNLGGTSDLWIVEINSTTAGNGNIWIAEIMGGGNLTLSYGGSGTHFTVV